MTEIVSIYDQWGTDKDVEQEGIVIDYGEAGWIRARRAGGANKAYQKALERFSRKHRRQIDLGILTESKANQELIQIFADTVVIDGELVDRSGKKVSLKNNKAAIAKFFTDLPDLFRDVRDQTMSIEAFRSFEREEEAKNSGRSSSSTSTSPKT